MEMNHHRPDEVTVNTPKTAAEVKPGDIVLRRLANYRPYEVESIEIITEHLWHRNGHKARWVTCDDRVFTWKPVGAARFHRGDRYRADDGIIVVEEG